MPSIKCGHCQQTHDAVIKVRACAAAAAAFDQQITATTAHYAQGVQASARGYGKIYDAIKQVGAQVPEGRYALVIADSTSFYRISKPTQGRWKGFVFVSVQAADDLYPLRGQGALDVLVQIAIDPQEAMLRYGREIGQCGHCGRTLTNEESRAAGIGPICRDKI